MPHDVDTDNLWSSRQNIPNLEAGAAFFHDDLDYPLKSAQICAAALRQARGRDALEDEVFDAKLLAILALAALVAVLIHSVNVRLQFFDFGIRVQPAVAAGNQRLLHKLDRTDDEAPFILRQQRMACAL